jgi:hypothetical protein
MPVQKFKRDPSVGSKVMAILTCYSSLTNQTSSSSPSCDSIATPRKTASGNSCKILSAIQHADLNLWPFCAVTQFWQPDLLVTELWFHINPKENSFRKLVQKFKFHPMVWSKVMAILTRFSSLADQTSMSSSSDYIETPRKTAFENSWKKFEGDTTVGSKVMAILTRYARLADQTSSSMSSDSKATRRKMASEKSCKNLSVIHWLDRNYGHFQPSLKSGRWDFLVIELALHINPKENGI